MSQQRTEQAAQHAATYAPRITYRQRLALTLGAKQNQRPAVFFAV